MNIKVGSGLILDETIASTSSDFPFVCYDISTGKLYTKTYSIPVATANTIGGIKVGTNLTIVDGVLSANTQSTSLSDGILQFSGNTLVPYTTNATDSTLSFRTSNNTALATSLTRLYLNGSLDLGSTAMTNTTSTLIARSNTGTGISISSTAGRLLNGSIGDTTSSIDAVSITNKSTSTTSKGIYTVVYAGQGVNSVNTNVSSNSTPNNIFKRTTPNASTTATGALFELRDYKLAGDGGLIVGRIGTDATSYIKFVVNPTASTGSTNYILDTDSTRQNTDYLLKVNNNGSTRFSVLATGDLNTPASITAGTSVNAATGNYTTLVTSPTFAGNLTGNASTASTLYTARTISLSGAVTGTATSFNGSANIVIPTTINSVPYSNITNLQYASAATDGILSSANWTVFNAKQPAGNYITALTGEVTASGPGSSTATVSNAAVIGKVLTGYVVTNGTISPTDSILQAIQKLGYDKHTVTTIGTSNGLSINGQQISMATASSSTTGALTSADWTEFDSKQPQLNGTGFVKASGTTITYDNSSYQPLDGDLTAIAALPGSSGIAKKLSSNTWTLDTTSYLSTSVAASTYQPLIVGSTTSTYYRGDKTFATLNKNAVGLSEVDNTSDLLKPISTATQAALDAKQDLIPLSSNTKYYRGDKVFATLNAAAVGLSNVDNTADLLKPTSNDTQSKLDSKQPLNSKLTTISGLSSNGVLYSDGSTITLNTDLIDGGNSSAHYHTTDRDRANHTGTQLASTVSDFSDAVRATTLTGLSSTNGAITSTDSVLTAFGKAQGQIAVRELSSNKGAASGYCPLGSDSKVPLSYLPNSLLKYASMWNASTNTPTLTNPDVNKAGFYYIVSTPGTQFGITWAVNDWLIYNASGVPEKADNSTGVVSINNKTGVVTLTKSDLSLGNVENTADLDKPVSTATWTELNKKQNTISGTGLVLSTSGTISYVTNNSANWNSAYTWGNHASAGYMVSASNPDLVAIEAISGTSGILKKTNTNTWALDTNTYLTTTVAAASYQPLDNDLSAIAAIGSTSGILKKTGVETWTLDTNTYLTTTAAASTYQPLDLDLTAIAAIPSASGFLKKNGANTWLLDTSIYLTGNQTITVTGDVTGSGTTGLYLTLDNEAVISQPISNYSPINGTITTDDSILSAICKLGNDRHVATTVTTTNGLSISGQNISLGLASGSTNGALSSAKYTEFSNKQNALTFGNITSSELNITGGTGSIIGSGVSMTINNSAVINKTLTGYSPASGNILITDTILTAFNKLGYDKHSAVTLGVSNGLSLSGQQLSMQVASLNQTGVITGAMYSTFTNKQNALVNQFNIKSINGQSILGSGDLVIPTTIMFPIYSSTSIVSLCTSQFINIPYNMNGLELKRVSASIFTGPVSGANNLISIGVKKINLNDSVVTGMLNSNLVYNTVSTRYSSTTNINYQENVLNEGDIVYIVVSGIPTNVIYGLTVNLELE